MHSGQQRPSPTPTGSRSSPAEGITGGCFTDPLALLPGPDGVRRDGDGRVPIAEDQSTGLRYTAARLRRHLRRTFACSVRRASGFSDWIEQLYAEGVTSGCYTDPLQYCPGRDNSRGEMAVFIVKTFGLQLYGP